MKKSFNDNWLFLDGENATTVSLPHTPKIEAYDVGMNYQGIIRYKKTFNIDKSQSGKRLIVEFEAIMQYCEIKVNGQLATVHYGGYLPVYVDITEIVHEGENTIEVMADNNDIPDIPPGKPLNVLDFCYFGGIYRNAWLHETDKLAFSLPVMKKKTAGGGVFVTYANVGKEKADVNVKINVENGRGKEQNATIKTILSFNGEQILCEEKNATIQEEKDFVFDFTVNFPKLWSPSSPSLYDLTVELYDDKGLIETYAKKIGIRSVSVKKGKFYLNGQAIKLYGTNRHQSFPYVGNAASDNAQYRDMALLKETGMNFVRLCHYPQAESVLDACDELGLMVTEPVPGWQWFSDTEQFRRIGIENAQDMLRRDRNHPCVVFWEATLNETHDTPDEFTKAVVQAIKAEYPTDQCLVSGDTIMKNAEFIGLDISHPTEYRFVKGMEDKQGLPPAWNGIQYFREYGDWDFGGNYSTSRKGREDGDVAMLLACWNQWYKYQKYFTHPEIIGMANWVGIDYNRGYCPEFPVCRCGILDGFRQKKFQFEMMRSQGSTEPMVFVANYWEKPESTEKIVVFSNCDEVELIVNGKTIEKRKPENGESTEYKIKSLYADPYYWADGTDAKNLVFEEHGNIGFAEKIDPLKLYRKNLMWNGSCAKNTIHPYFVFDNVRYEKGYVEAIGYIDEKEAARHKVCSYDKPAEIKIIADDKYAPLKADDNDFIFVNAKVVDKNGNLVYNFTDKVKFEIKNGSIVGPSEINAIAGIATVMVKATADLEISATYKDICSVATIKTIKQPKI